MAANAPQQNQAPAATLPSPEVAYQTLFDGVHQRAFFGKMAQLRPEYLPQNEKQASDLLELAGKLRLVDQEAVVKEAEESLDPFAAANAALDQTMAHYGFGAVKAAAAQEESVAIKSAAADLMNDPDIYNSVLALKANEAETYLAQLQAQQQQQGSGR